PASDDDLGGGVAEGDIKREVKEIAKVASTGFVRGQFTRLGLVRGNAVAKVEAHAEHAHVHEHEASFEHEHEEDADIDVSASFAQIKALVQEAVGSPVASAVAAVEQRLTDLSARSSKRDVYAKRAAEARLKGYEGDACGSCGNFTLVRNGTCLKCDNCG